MKTAAPSAEAQSPDEAIYAQILEAIGSQRLPPGTRLREDEMRAIFSVSRSRIRKVFSRLAYDGLVVIEPNRGASVARPSVKDARELFEARRGIEATIVATVTAKLGSREKQLLRDHLAKERQADTARNHADMIRLSGEFHALLAEIAENRILARFLNELITRESLVIQAYERPGRPSCSCHEHEGILAAIEGRDAARSVSLMMEHLSNIEARLDLDGNGQPAIRLAQVFSR